jgi:hypothetical protein
LREDDISRGLWIGGEEAPVDVGAVADVWVVGFSGGGLEDLLDEGLGGRGVLEVKFYDCGEDLELGLL